MRKKEWGTNSFIVAMDGWFRKLFVRKEKRILFSDALNYLRKFGLRFTIYETFKTFSNDRIAINFFLSFFDNFRRYLWKYISICLWVCILFVYVYVKMRSWYRIWVSIWARSPFLNRCIVRRDDDQLSVNKARSTPTCV